MSAFILDDINFDYLLTALGEHDCAKLGQVLKDQNYRSVNHRYNQKKKTPRYLFRRIVDIDYAQVLKICDCYDYQSCETNDYYSTEAYKIISRVRKTVIRKLVGYEDAKWGLSEEDRNQSNKNLKQLDNEVKEVIKKALLNFSGTLH